jgi:hypothetical protein
MNQDFSPGGFSRPTGYPANFQQPQPAPWTKEQIERERYRRENRFEQLRAPGPDCVFSIAGQMFTSTRHPMYGWVWTLPSRLVNQYIHAREIQLGDGATLRLTLAPAPEVSGTTY